jgi:hypothetical protein
MRIGVSLMTGNSQHVWNNGLVQNIYHFVKLLESIPFVESVCLLNCGDRDDHPHGLDEEGRRIPLLSLADAFHHVDVAIEMGGAIDMEWIRRLRHRGGKVIQHLCGQPYVALIEPTVFKRDGFFLDPERFDEIWILTKDMPFASMLETIYRCPVREVPYLWSPRFLEQTIEKDEEGNRKFGYRPGSLKPGSVCPSIFEPNLSPIKMGLIPVLICEAIQRRRPDLIGRMVLHNSDRMLEHLSFVYFMQNLEIYRSGKSLLVARDYFAHVMGREFNLVVSHQINCPQNYLYLDALYGGYPLIHNSILFKDAGYFYPESDVEAGAEAFLHAVEHHDRDFADYQRRGQRAIDALSPIGPDNLSAYARLLISLTSTDTRRRYA